MDVENKKPIRYTNVLDVSSQLYHTDNIGFKFYQFLLALNGALIAYTSKLIDLEKSILVLLFVVVSILLWSVSFYNGIKSINSILLNRNFEITVESEKDKKKQSLMDIKYSKMTIEANKRVQKLQSFLIYGILTYAFAQVLKFLIITEII